MQIYVLNPFQSHVLRNTMPTFVFTVKSMDVDSRIMKNGQIVNHFEKSKHITTKVAARITRIALTTFKH